VYGAVAQLDDTRLGLRKFVALKGACGKTTTSLSGERIEKILVHNICNEIFL
jgi:hypothetical protein